MKEKIAEIAHEIAEMESPLHECRHIAMALRMMGSADDVPEDVGDPLSALAEILIASLRKLQDDRTEIWRQTLALKEALKDV
jgi:hypothetical protein